MRSLALLACLALILPLAACSSGSSACCQYGQPSPSLNAACRCGVSCIWPPEKGKLGAGDVPLTPSLNKFLGCPPFESDFKYTRAPFCCEEDVIVR